MAGETVRYALYYAPAPDSALWRFGSGILGYDAATGAEVPLLPFAGFSETGQRAVTAEPARYGFHATLKAPFHLTEGRDEGELLAMAANFATQQPGVPAVPLKVALLSHFVALVPARSAPEQAIAALERGVVEAFEPFRAPLTEAGLARRNPDALTPRQRDNLRDWGYPYVLSEFRFHMTLTGPLDPDLRQLCLDSLTEAFATEVPDHATAIDRLLLYRQSEPTARFRIAGSFPLATPSAQPGDGATPA
jgi:putative phosphonate metabolism protein